MTGKEYHKEAGGSSLKKDGKQSPSAMGNNAASPGTKWGKAGMQRKAGEGWVKVFHLIRLFAIV
jgi:hypothetical protein